MTEAELLFSPGDAQTMSSSTLPVWQHTVLAVSKLSVHLIPLSLRKPPSDSSVWDCEHSHALDLTSRSCYTSSFTGIWSQRGIKHRNMLQNIICHPSPSPPSSAQNWWPGADAAFTDCHSFLATFRLRLLVNDYWNTMFFWLRKLLIKSEAGKKTENM